MHHLYPLAKGDPLCPLGFHPQVRWPTRCKRCFRDYKEHGGKKKEEDMTVSTPILSTWNSSSSRSRDDERSPVKEAPIRGWVSSQNLSQESSKTEKTEPFSTGFGRPSASWTSTPDLGNLNDDTKAVTVSLTLPRKRSTTTPTPLDTGQSNIETQTVIIKRPQPVAAAPPSPSHLIITKNDSLAERVRKVKSARSNTSSRPPIRGGPVREEVNGSKGSDSDSTQEEDNSSVAETTTTETTLVDRNQFNAKELEKLKEEMEVLRKRCERVEKEKSEILLRRLASLDSSTSKTSTRPSEMLKLQQKINELSVQNEDLRDEKKSLQIRVREIEAELESRPSPDVATKTVEQLRSKLKDAEALCEELMDENEDMKRELRSMEEEIEEMQDNFREDQADEYSSLRKELELTTKNCRVLSFKLKKTERKAEQLDQEKSDHEKKLLELAGGVAGMDKVNRIKQLEQELTIANEVAIRFQRELQEANIKLAQQPTVNIKKAPTLGLIGKSLSSDSKPSRASLTRGGSQEDPQQLLRDLQDSLEREADLREQLKNAEEEGANLRKRASRAEDDNESLALQLKKMATKARTRKLSPTAPSNRLSVDNSVDKDEGISDEEDPAELRILLELNEQEASVLRRKVEELEHEGESLKNQVKDLADKLSSANIKPATTIVKKLVPSKTSTITEEKVKILEGELAELRKKLIEKERDVERLHAELSITQKRSKGSLMKSKSLDGANEQQNVDLKRQLQLIEQEATILRTKTQTLETDNETLQAENKKLQLLRGTKSFKSDKSNELNNEKITQLESELKDAMSKIKELEIAKDSEKVEKKVTFGSAAAAKKDADLKAKQEELDKLKLSMKKTETEKNQLNDVLKQLKEEAVKSFKPRIPKKPTDLTTKLQMKKMVDELEGEIGEMYVVMKNAGLDKLDERLTEKAKMEKTIEELHSKLTGNESEFVKEKLKLKSEIEKLNAINETFEKEKLALLEKQNSYESERDEALRNYKNLQESNKKLDAQVALLNQNLKTSASNNTTLEENRRKIDDLKREMSEKDQLVDKLKRDLELADKGEQDKSKLLKDVGDKAKKIADLEKKLKEADEKCKRTDKMLLVRKDRVAKLEKELSEEKEQNDNIMENQRRMSYEYTSEKDRLMIKLVEGDSKLEKIEVGWKERLAEFEGKVVTLESQLCAKNAHIKQLEDSLSSTSQNKGDSTVSTVELAQVKEQLDMTKREIVLKEQELATIRQELLSKQQEATKLHDDLAGSKQECMKLQHEKKDIDNSTKSQAKELKNLESKISELEIDYSAEKKKVERMKVIHEKDIKNKELELGTLKGKLRTLEQTSGAGSKKIEELKKEYDVKLSNLESELSEEKKEYDELTSKYELLEEEHVVTKAKLTIEKESVQGDLLQIQRELSNSNSELKSLQETYNNKTDAWIKEKIDLQEKMSSLEERLCGGGWEVEKARLVAKLDQKEREVDRIAKERDVTNHLQDALKREVEELRKKLDDYDRVTKIQRNLTLENTNMEREIKALQNKLDQSEKGKKSDVIECKLRYESQMQSVQDELQSVQSQVTRFKRERDTYKQMLDGAHKTMSEMRSGEPIIRNKSGSKNVDELEEFRAKVDSQQEQISNLEDGLCEAKLDSSKAKTELVSERSMFEIRLAEMQSKLNEFEEDRLIASGRTKIPGLRTRLELAWQKEREEQQRLLQETSTLARDLRQTLFEVERERDKEKLDIKRRLEQLKKSAEEENDESKKKVTELQCDLLELRDAHAKLRTTNEKLRREKERHDRERDQHKMSIATLKRSQQDEDKKIGYLLDLVDELTKSVSEIDYKNGTQTPSYLTPTPPRRHRSKSRSRSREATPEDSSIAEAGSNSILAKLKGLAQEVRASQSSDRQKRQINMRRAVSIEPNNLLLTPTSQRRTSSLKKRSISLEQTTQEQNKIWKTDEDSMSSLQSLDTEALDNRIYTMQRETSMDSRLSGGSTQSDILPSSGKKKKKGLFGKLKQLTKSSSIDNADNDPGFPPIGSVSHGGGSESDMSVTGSKKDLKGRLSGMFSRKSASGSTSSISKEKKKELSTPVATRTASLQRPLSKNGSTSQLSRMSPASDAGSLPSRAVSVTPGLQRKKA